MTTIPLHNFKTKKTSSITVDEKVFGIVPNTDLIAQAIRVHNLNQQSGLAHTKTRAEVAGGGHKPWKQKGTGRARASSTRSPLWRGGGTTFGPRKHDVSAKLPKKMKQLAFRSGLSSKAADNKVFIYEELSLTAPKTKLALAALQQLPAMSTCLIVSSPSNALEGKAFHNLPHVAFMQGKLPSIYEILRFEYILIDKDVLTLLSDAKEVEESTEKAPKEVAPAPESVSTQQSAEAGE